MGTKSKSFAVSVYANGKPRSRRSGNWKLNCHGHEHVAADIECFVRAVEMTDCGHGKGFFLRMPTPEHCEFVAEWLMKAASFARQQSNQRTASGMTP
jgi:hypothetical protein